MMSKTVGIEARSLPEESKSVYPGPYKDYVNGRHRRRLGDAFGLANFGVNLTRLDPGARSSLRHWHTRQDELLYVVEGELTLVTDAGAEKLTPGMIAGFRAGTTNGHQLINETDRPAFYLEIGDRTPGDDVTYPDADLFGTTKDGKRVWVKRDGSDW